MTDMQTSNVENDKRGAPAPSRPNQRPSFRRGSDPIDRLPFVAHWLLSVVLLIVVPLVMLQVVEAAGLFALLGPLMVLSIVPGTLLYVISARRRLIGMGARPQWLLLIVPFVLVSLANGYDGFMRATLPGAEMPPTLPPAVSILMLPAMILHVVLMVRRGKGASASDR